MGNDYFTPSNLAPAVKIAVGQKASKPMKTSEKRNTGMWGKNSLWGKMRGKRQFSQHKQCVSGENDHVCPTILPHVCPAVFAWGKTGSKY